MNKFKVYDNFLVPSYANYLETLMLSKSIRWEYQDHMDHDDSYPQEVLGILDEGYAIAHSIMYYTLAGVIGQIIDELMPDQHPVRIRGVKQHSISDNIQFYPPHTDMTDDGGYSLIYYPTDCTGDTYLFGEKDINDVSFVENNDTSNYNWEPIDHVSPKKNRIIVFPSNNYHAGSPPSEMRYLINFNFLPLNNLT